MKALPSIAFNEFKGSAGDVTARVSKGRQVLSARSMHSSSKTPAQAVSRNRLAKISRSYKKLTDEQMKAWAVLAEKMKGISTFGQAAELTPHNAFVRINSNRAMVGMPTQLFGNMARHAQNVLLDIGRLRKDMMVDALQKIVHRCATDGVSQLIGIVDVAATIGATADEVAIDLKHGSDCFQLLLRSFTKLCHKKTLS